MCCLNKIKTQPLTGSAMKPTCNCNYTNKDEKVRNTLNLDKKYLNYLHVGSPTWQMEGLCEGGNKKRNIKITNI